MYSGVKTILLAKKIALLFTELFVIYCCWLFYFLFLVFMKFMQLFFLLLSCTKSCEVSPGWISLVKNPDFFFIYIYII